MSAKTWVSCNLSLPIKLRMDTSCPESLTDTLPLYLDLSDGNLSPVVWNPFLSVSMIQLSFEILVLPCWDQSEVTWLLLWMLVLTTPFVVGPSYINVGVLIFRFHYVLWLPYVLTSTHPWYVRISWGNVMIFCTNAQLDPRMSPWELSCQGHCVCTRTGGKRGSTSMSQICDITVWLISLVKDVIYEFNPFRSFKSL